MRPKSAIGGQPKWSHAGVRASVWSHCTQTKLPTRPQKQRSYEGGIAGCLCQDQAKQAKGRILQVAQGRRAGLELKLGARGVYECRSIKQRIHVQALVNLSRRGGPLCTSSRLFVSRCVPQAEPQSSKFSAQRPSASRAGTLNEQTCRPQRFARPRCLAVGPRLRAGPSRWLASQRVRRCVLRRASLATGSNTVVNAMDIVFIQVHGVCASTSCTCVARETVAITDSLPIATVRRVIRHPVALRGR